MATSLERSNCCFNVITVVSWVLFSLFLLSQPWLSNWANNKYSDYVTTRTQYDFPANGTFRKRTFPIVYGICTIPASQYVCTDGANFTELALKYRPNHPYACGCGEGILGEGLCPRTSYGHTLSDYVSTTPALGAMLGFATFPLIGARQLMSTIMKAYNPGSTVSFLLYGSLNSFQVNFVLWGISSICIFPTAHALLTVTFLGSFMVFALTVLFLFHKAEHTVELDQKMIVIGATVSFFAITLGAIPRIFLTIDGFLQSPVFPDLNKGGIGSYVFWFGEAVGLSVFFGLYPVVFLSKLAIGEASWTSGEGDAYKEGYYEESEYETDEEA